MTWNLLYLALIPVVIFVVAAGMRFGVAYLYDKNKWWSFPLWMALSVPTVAITVAVLVGLTALAFGGPR